MVSIKKDVDVTVLVLAFFILSFLVFLFMKPDITGMASINTLSIADINIGSSLVNTNNIVLNFVSGDIQPCDSTLVLNISNSTGGQFYYITKTFEQFITSASAFCTSGKFIASVPSLTSSISFLGIGNFDTAGTYTFNLNF